MFDIGPGSFLKYLHGLVETKETRRLFVRAQVFISDVDTPWRWEAVGPQNLGCFATAILLPRKC